MQSSSPREAQSQNCQPNPKTGISSMLVIMLSTQFGGVPYATRTHPPKACFWVLFQGSIDVTHHPDPSL